MKVTFEEKLTWVDKFAFILNGAYLFFTIIQWIVIDKPTITEIISSLAESTLFAVVAVLIFFVIATVIANIMARPVLFLSNAEEPDFQNIKFVPRNLLEEVIGV